ncbi:hypothetical protein VMCG_07422 [Cytospora schulzeri]|uniref:Uncharacterized protein n=1 Tax=Cytospora schulzeri TaxID=448051 RepID=A0A423W301_9PEZI|nr:hypothetical protein VMCG_07422 [Valsa malicola]
MGRSYKQGLPEACMNDYTYWDNSARVSGKWDWFFGLPQYNSVHRVDASLSFQLEFLEGGRVGRVSILAFQLLTRAKSPRFSWMEGLLSLRSILGHVCQSGKPSKMKEKSTGDICRREVFQAEALS